MSQRDKADQSTPDALVARIRRRATRELHSQSQHQRDVLEALLLLRRLTPSQLKTAALCHEMLVAQSRHDLAEMGFVCDWFGLVQLVYDFLDTSGQYYQNRQWTSYRELVESQRVTV